MQKIINYVKKEAVMLIALALALISCFFAAPSVKYFEYIDYKVLTCLFCLMIVVSGFSKINALDIIAQKLLQKANTMRKLYLIIIFLTYFAAMLITNDVALITFVPLTIKLLSMCRRLKYTVKFIVLQTIAANLGSSLTPIGNPQNLYLFSYYDFTTADFFSVTLPLVLFSGLLLLICTLSIKNERLSIDTECTVVLKSRSKAIIYLLLFIISVLSVFDVIIYTLTLAIVIITMIISDKKLFSEVDYSLLFTFIGFFIFVGNISDIDMLKILFSKIIAGRELFFAIAVSQLISNVPAALLLSKFTDCAKEILLGVNIGGLGTLIASLASVISYKIYCKQNDALKGKYMLAFTIFNIIFLIFVAVFMMVYLRLAI